MISVIIPVYKNKELFLASLTNNLQYLNGCEIIVVNDDPSQSLKDNLNEFQTVILLENKKNLGFGPSVNIGVGKAKNKYLMLLNSDVLLTHGKYKQVIDNFEKDKELFAVSFAQEEKDGSLVGKNRIYWHKGMFMHQRKNNTTAGYNAWAEGGACIIDKNKFLELGGFDPIYSPFYWEDIDLSYRAWKRGYKILFTPEVVVKHRHESTIGKYFGKNTVKIIAYRNQFLFIWKNIIQKKLFFNHLIFLFPTLFKLLLKGEFSALIGFFNALLKLNLIFKKRPLEKKERVKSDYEILDLFR